MKSIISFGILALLLADSASAVNLSRGTISCEELHTCAPKVEKTSKDFVADYDANSLYSFTEQDNI